MPEIRKTSRSYIKQQLSLAVAVALVCLLAMRVWFLDLLLPVIIGFAFVVVLAIALGKIWERVARNHPESLPTFFTAASGARLLLALATMFVYYMASQDDSMLRFFLVFMAFYVVSLAHHAIFFANVSKKTL